MRTVGLWFEYIPGWCAGVKASGLDSEFILNHPQNTLENIIEDAKEECGYQKSCLVVSANEEEIDLNTWLQKNKFIPGPVVVNKNHGGRKTALFFLPI